MYLKRLESAGFKSFAERIHVEFVPGVTAVVGPNGSGKSNITDAIRWVLGEQSAKSLRGSTMEDIIFQGSDTRNALNVADVTLVLDNADQTLPLDYHEVSVTRRVYRSGESEFYINKQSCRLKDIIDLFMDSGLGREAFSIISQGKVEEILSSRPDERRVIFEEAAGVLKYKQRKKQAEFKLNETQDNLSRVEDIIHEIKQQLDPMQEQAEKAKTYQSYKAKLNQQEISLLVTEIHQYHNQWQNLLSELENDKQKETELKTSINKREADLEQDQSDINNLDDAIETLQNDLMSVAQRLEQYEGKKQVLQERLRHFSENKSKLESDIDSTSNHMSDLDARLQEANVELERLKTDKQQTDQRIQTLEQNLDSNEEEIDDKIEDAKSDYIEYLNQQAAIRNEKQSTNKQKEQLIQRLNQQTQTYEHTLSDRDELNQKVAEAEKEYNEYETFYQQRSAELQQLKQDLENDRSDFQNAQDQLNTSYRSMEKMKSQKEMLEGMKEDFQGFYYGVKSVLKAREDHQLKDIHGAMIELLDVPDDYITAIETTLGAQAQNIVVDDDRAARQAINWLKNANQGRATFLPLSSIRERFVPDKVLNDIRDHKGYIGVAADLIQIDDHLKKAAQHLMGHVIIADTLENANDLAQKVMRKFRIVTLGGDVVNPGGAMSGGAKKKTNQSLFTRDKELASVTEKLNDLQTRTDRFKEKVDAKQTAIHDKENKISALEEEVANQHNHLVALQGTYRELVMKRDSLDEKVMTSAQDYQKYNEEIEQLNTQETNLSSQLETLQTKLQQVQDSIDQMNKQKQNLEQNRGNMQEELHKLQIETAEQKTRINHQEEKTQELQNQLSEARSEYDKHVKDLNDLLALKESEGTEADMDEEIASIQAEKEALTEKIQAKRTERYQRSQSMQDQERELKETKKQHQSLQESLQQTEVQANRYDVELETRLDRLQKEYVLTYEKAEKNYPKVEDVDDVKQQVETLKHSIDQLGHVNLGAIEEYDRLSKRYTFLTGQQDDLLEAKQTLHQVIAEMDEEMISRFESTFNQVKSQFSEVFKALFGGGYAELKLTDPDNLLETGIDIIAQPPGKKLQHLGLLSGGERALTAIALLFAILHVRPVPFCILDEVEAALDEANLMRFASYIKHFSAQTQFIVITHRKVTMEAADVLYGITMQESGVSRLVSVRLEDTHELVNS